MLCLSVESSMLLRRNLSPKSFSLLQSLPFSTAVTPPIPEWPHHLTPNHLISLITREPNLSLALQIFHHASNHHPSFRHTYHTYHAILRRLLRSRSLHLIPPLLSSLRAANLRCSEDLFVTLIRHYGVVSLPKLAFQTFLSIPAFHARRSSRSLNALLNALVQNHHYRLVHSVFRNCKERFGVAPNVFSCNILIKALCNRNDLDTAHQVLDEMPAMSFVPNVVTFTTILGGYVARRDMVGARRVFGEILDRGWSPDVTTYTILMDGYVKQGKLVEAIKVMDEMEENGVGANEVTYGVMIEGYCKEKKSGEAVNLIDDMVEKSYIPSSALCCKVVDVLCCEGKVEEACKLWKRLLKKNCSPDNAVLGTLIYWLCKKGQIWEARKLFDQLETSEAPDVMTYNVLISGMCEAGELCEAGRLWDDMVKKGYSPSSFTYSVLIKGFCKIEKAKEGIRILDEMIEQGCLPNKSTYAMLIQGLCDSGNEAEITRVISMAMSSGNIDSDSWDLFLNKVVSDLDTGPSVLNRILLESTDRVPDIVALEYSDLDLIHNGSQVLVEVPYWNQVFRDPRCAVMVDIGTVPRSYFKRKHRKRQAVQKPLVVSIVNN